MQSFYKEVFISGAGEGVSSKQRKGEKEFFVAPKPQRTKMGVAEVLVFVCR